MSLGVSSLGWGADVHRRPGGQACKVKASRNQKKGSRVDRQQGPFNRSYAGHKVVWALKAVVPQGARSETSVSCRFCGPPGLEGLGAVLVDMHGPSTSLLGRNSLVSADFVLENVSPNTGSQ